MHRVHGLLKWTRGGLPQMNYVNKSTFQMDKRWTTTNGLPKQSDVSDQSSGAEHPNKHASDPTSVRLANVKAESAEIYQKSQNFPTYTNSLCMPCGLSPESMDPVHLGSPWTRGSAKCTHPSFYAYRTKRSANREQALQLTLGKCALSE